MTRKTKRNNRALSPAKACIAAVAAGALTLGVCSAGFAAESAGNGSIGAAFGEQCQSIINALQIQAQYRTEHGSSVEVDADEGRVVTDAEYVSSLAANGNASLLAAGDTYPASFDLRNCDLDGTGQACNYVTSVKWQSPFATCWAFAALAASETSIMSEQRLAAVAEDAEGNKYDTIDLSEHHLAWFNYAPLTASENASQAGEGAYSIAEEEAEGEFKQSQRLNTGGMGMSVTTTFATGTGAVIEPDEDTTLSALEKQLLYRGKEGKTYKGRVYSDEDDWSIDSSQRYLADYQLDETTILPDAATYDETGTYSKENADYVTGLMKQQLLEGRAINICFFADLSMPSDSASRFINTDTWAHYTYQNKGGNHCVTIVGWDDSYSKGNFLTQAQEYDENDNPVYNDDGTPKMISVEQPPADGAWIVKNSWGSSDSWGQGLNKNNWGVDGSGYFYLSYYDMSLRDEETYDFNTEDATADADEELITNQYDYMPCEAARAIEQDASVTCANVFTASTAQEITQLSCITSTADEDVTYELYRLTSTDQRIDEGELLCTVDVHYDFAGFHKLQLSDSYYMGSGQVFAVAVTQKSQDGYLMGVASDYNREGYDAGLGNGDSCYVKGVVNKGESWLHTSSDDTWTDFSEVKAQLESASGDTHYFSYDNFPIKAYGMPADEKTDIAKATVTLDVQTFTYDGKAHAPQVTVTVDANGIALTEGTDYTLSGDLEKTEVGTYTLKVAGIGAYTGSTQAQWSISAAAVSPTEASTSAKTGDSLSMVVLVALAATSAAAATALLTARTRRRH